MSGLQKTNSVSIDINEQNSRNYNDLAIAYPCCEIIVSIWLDNGQIKVSTEYVWSMCGVCVE